MIIYGSASSSSWSKVAVYNGNTDLYDAKSLCMTQSDDPNLIDRTEENQDHLESGWMWQDGKSSYWAD